MKAVQLAAAELIEFIAGRLLNEALDSRNPSAIRKARRYYERAGINRDRLAKRANQQKS